MEHTAFQIVAKIAELRQGAARFREVAGKTVAQARVANRLLEAAGELEEHARDLEMHLLLIRPSASRFS